ncbi:hypothetical protein HMPREF1548_05300 [Clostridium sp. KLE 1755]|nr:hypothetical protein HMPREF1548_05300 [Clostridium sp. KLE 1755]
MQPCRLLQALISKNPDKLEFFCATIICPGFLCILSGCCFVQLV